jgi:tetratricopeptide (TPR) repeat protein
MTLNPNNAVYHRSVLAWIVTWLLAGWSVAGTAESTDNPAARFNAANKLYEQGKYAEAATQYNGILQENLASPALYYNLGNACFKAGESGRAIAAYLQAEELAPRDPDLRANLQFVRNQIQGPTLSASHWQMLAGRLTINEWSWLAMLALWTWFALLIILQWRPWLKPALRGYLYATGISASGLCLCLAMTVYMHQVERTAVVTSPEVTAHNGPLEESPSAFSLHDGAELKVLDEKDQWLQINTGTPRSGWIRRDQVFILPRN